MPSSEGILIVFISSFRYLFANDLTNLVAEDDDSGPVVRLASLTSLRILTVQRSLSRCRALILYCDTLL